MSMLLYVLAGCGPAPVVATPTDTETDADVDADADGDADTDTDTDTDPAPSNRCPTGMVPIPPEAPLYCIDAWEGSIDGRLGSDDQYASDAEPPDAVEEAVPGNIPTTGVTWSQVMAVCAMTPAVDPATGIAYGFKRLARSSEWEDAGDGVIGEGGTDWPWGDEPDETRCAVVRTDGEDGFRSLQPTGSLPGCVGPWGVYDQIGNAWEWTDSGIPMSISTWLDANPALTVSGTSVIATDRGIVGSLTISAPEVTGSVGLGKGDVIVFHADSASWTHGDREARGYLETRVSDDPQRSQLPVGLTRVSDDGVTAELSVRVATEADGVNFPDKRGGAYYSGEGVDLHDASFEHFYDFGGTITLRCVADATPPLGWAARSGPSAPASTPTMHGTATDAKERGGPRPE